MKRMTGFFAGLLVAGALSAVSGQLEVGEVEKDVKAPTLVSAIAEARAEHVAKRAAMSATVSRVSAQNRLLSQISQASELLSAISEGTTAARLSQDFGGVDEVKVRARLTLVHEIVTTPSLRLAPYAGLGG